MRSGASRRKKRNDWYADACRKGRMELSEI
jgi:hypothetical protein